MIQIGQVANAEREAHIHARAGLSLCAILTTSALSFFHLPQFPTLQIPPEWQVGAQGIILIIILAIRAFINQRDP